jgi:ribosomal protein S18 acetylase RimI-like enzyme
MNVRTVDAPFPDGLRGRLGEILIDAVEDGASVGFLAPLSAEEADAYWRRVERAVAESRCVLLVAESGGAVAGTVQLDVDTMPNQPHRATVSKLLVHTGARRSGLGEALMLALEEAAAAAGRWLLVLDTATAAAERLYRRLGWTAAGTVPDYALNPDGSLTKTVFYWKSLAAAPTPDPPS